MSNACYQIGMVLANLFNFEEKNWRCYLDENQLSTYSVCGSEKEKTNKINAHSFPH